VDDQRLQLAEAFLREAVYRSRERQAASAVLGAPASGGGQCGLGEKAAVVLDLTPRAAELFRALWPQGAEAERVRAGMADWVVAQDQLDRKRNHFLKATRLKHGFDRDAYAADVLAEFEAGLARINAEEDAARRAAAAALLGA
jgi:hypothetical protein